MRESAAAPRDRRASQRAPPASPAIERITDTLTIKILLGKLYKSRRLILSNTITSVVRHMLRRKPIVYVLASISLILPVGVISVASSAASSPASASSVFTNSGPVFETQAFAYRPGIGIVHTPSVPYEKTYQTGGVTGEGQIQVGSNGDVFEYGPSFTDGLRRSTDSGHTWEVIQPPSTPACASSEYDSGYDHTIWYGAGRLFLAASGTPQVNMSDTDGTTWSSTCGQQATGAEESWNADRANIFGGPPSHQGKQPTTSYPDLLYYCGQSVKGNDEPGTFYTLCEVSYDGGATWTNTNQAPFTEPLNGCDALAPASMPNSSRAGGPWTPDINWGYVGPDGTVYVGKNFCGKPYVAMSSNNGNSWTRVQVSSQSRVGILSGNATQYGGYEEGTAADKHGDVFFTWIGANGLPYLAVSTDHGRTWSQPIMYAAPGVNTAFWPFISIDSQGRLDLMYMGTSSSGYTSSTEQWFEYTAEMPLPTSGPHPLIYSATTTPSSYPWRVGPGGPDRAPDNCGCDYVSVASAPNGAAWSLTDDFNTQQLGALASVLGPPPVGQ